MKQQNSTPLLYVHLTLMTLLWIANLVMIFVFHAARSDPAMEPLLINIPNVTLAMVVNLTNIAALCAGILYLVRRYRKDAVGFYKTFMLLTAVACLVYGISAANTLVPANEARTVQLPVPALTVITVCFSAIKLIALLVLTFQSDLGRRRSMVIYTIIIVLDLTFEVLRATPGSIWYLQASAALSRLLMDTTIGLAIAAKFRDKARRAAELQNAGGSSHE